MPYCGVWTLRRRSQSSENRSGSHDIDVFALICDVGEEAQIDLMIEKVTQKFGRIDILVNNAGAIQVGTLETSSASDFRKAMDTLFSGMFIVA